MGSIDSVTYKHYLMPKRGQKQRRRQREDTKSSLAFTDKSRKIKISAGIDITSRYRRLTAVHTTEERTNQGDREDVHVETPCERGRA